MQGLLVASVVWPLLSAAVLMLLRRWPAVQRLGALASACLYLVNAVTLLLEVVGGGTLVTQLGNWPAPFGISFVADTTSALLIVLTGVMNVVVNLFAQHEADQDLTQAGYFPLVQVLIMGVSGAFLTGDLFNLYVWFEVLLMASFVLLVLQDHDHHFGGAIKYFTLNLLSSALFLAAVGVLFGTTQTLNMADLHERVRMLPPPLALTLALLFLVAFGIKAALFPLFFWLPAAYHTLPAGLGALFAALLTKVGVYALLRVFTLIFPAQWHILQPVLVVLAGLTMLIGVWGAVSQVDYRRILAFHSVSQVGYMLMGLAIGTPEALAASVLFILHHGLVKSNLFLLSGCAQHAGGSTYLKKLGGLATATPLLAGLFFITAMSLAGLPPFSGFWAKLGLIKVGLATNHWWLVAIALVVSVFTTISMLKIWSEAYWKPQPSTTPGHQSRPVPHTWRLAVIIMTGLALGIGLAGQPLVELTLTAGRELLDPRAYVQAVLGWH